MAVYDVSYDSGLTIDFTATGNAEILQNVAMILASVTYSCPMARSFAWDGSVLDRPMNVAMSLLSSRLITAITEYESRVEVESITFESDDNGLTGMLKPVVKVRITDDG